MHVTNYHDTIRRTFELGFTHHLVNTDTEKSEGDVWLARPLSVEVGCNTTSILKKKTNAILKKKHDVFQSNRVVRNIFGKPGFLCVDHT